MTRPQSRVTDFYREIGDLFGLAVSTSNRWGAYKAVRAKWQEHIHQTLFRPVLLVDGAVAGVWHHRRSGRSVDITVEPLAPLSADRRKALATAVERVAEILQARPRWTIGTVSVGPHA